MAPRGMHCVLVVRGVGHWVLCPLSCCCHFVGLLEPNWESPAPSQLQGRQRIPDGENPPSQSLAGGTELGWREASPGPSALGTSQPGVPAPQPQPGLPPVPRVPLMQAAKESLGPSWRREEVGFIWLYFPYPDFYFCSLKSSRNTL